MITEIKVNRIYLHSEDQKLIFTRIYFPPNDQNLKEVSDEIFPLKGMIDYKRQGARQPGDQNSTVSSPEKFMDMFLSTDS